MIIFREHPMFFLGLKYVQLLLSILVIIFEITQYVTYGQNYILPGQYNDWFEKAQKGGDSNGEFKIWLLVVCSLTILSLVYNLISFKKIWEKGFNVWIEILFTALWLSAGLSNLDPVYRGTNDLNCKSHSLEENPPKRFICNVWVTSLIFGWFIFGTFMLAAFISLQLSKEAKEKTKWIKRSYPESYNNNKNNNRKSFYVSSVPHPIITIQNNSSDELEKGGVPELLLQSGLPADHRMSLKVVLPQSGPFSQSRDDSENQQQPQPQQQQQQKQDEISNNLAFPLPPAKVNGSTITLPDVSDVEQHETFNSNHLVLPSKKSAEVSSLHEVPL